MSSVWKGSNTNMIARPGETRVFYYMDDDEKPLMKRLNIPLEQVTLADFKQLIGMPLNTPHTQFFFRSTDPEMGDYKEEILDNNVHLPPYKNTIVALVVSRDVSVRSDSDSNRSSRSLIPQRKSLDNGSFRNPRNFSSSTSYSANSANGGAKGSYRPPSRPSVSARPNVRIFFLQF